MALKSDDDQVVNPDEEVSLLEKFKLLHEQALLEAHELHEQRYVYYFFAVFDSLSSSYSMFKYFFDLTSTSSDPNALHDFMLTPEGIAVIVVETVFLVSFSFLAALFDKEPDKDDDQKNKYMAFVASAWPYFRDLMKGLKNAFKGWRSALILLSLLSISNVHFLIMPLGIVLGILAAANRLMLRHIKDRRDVMKKTNNRLLAEIRNSELVTKWIRKRYEELLMSQDDAECYRGFLGAVFGGVIDGLYLYVGVLSIAALSPQIILPLLVISGIYTLACVITRLYEEYQYQLKIQIVHTECIINLIMKQIESNYNELLLLQSKKNKSLDDGYEIERLEKEIYQLIEEFDVTRSLLLERTTKSYGSAILSGIQNGLYAYSALCSVMFVVGAVLMLSSVPCPPLFLMIGVPMGLFFIVLFVVHSLVENYIYTRNLQEKIEQPYHELMRLKFEIEEQNEEQNSFLVHETFLACLRDGLNLDPSPQFFFQEWFEVIRSFFSGVAKGYKFVEFAGNPLQEPDDYGQYRDTPIMWILMGVSSAAFALVLTLRAFAKELGKKSSGQFKLKKDNQDAQPPAPPQDQATNTLDTSTLAKPTTPLGLGSFSSLFSFFKDNEQGNKTSAAMVHSKSTTSLVDMAQPNNTVLGLD